MNTIDIILIILILAVSLIEIKGNILIQIDKLIDVIISVVLSFFVKNILFLNLSLTLPIFSVDKDIVSLYSLNILLYSTLSLVLSFIIIYFLIRIAKKFSSFTAFLNKKDLNRKILLPIKLIVSIIRATLIIYMALLFVKQPIFNINDFNESKLTSFLLNVPVLKDLSKNYTKSYEEIDEYKNNYLIDKKNYNKEIIQVLINNKIITIEEFDSLVESGKFVNINYD